MAAITSPFTAVGQLAVEKNSGDPVVQVSLYGTYAGLQFAFQWSPDNTNGWAPLVVTDVSNGDEVSGTIAPVDNSSNGWNVPCARKYVRMNVTAISSGTVTVVAISIPADIVGGGSGGGGGIENINITTPATRIEVNTAITTVGAGTLTAAAIVGGLITRTGPTAAYTDTTDTAANIIAALPALLVGMSWEVNIKNTVPFNATLAGGTGVTLTGPLIIPPNSTYMGLLTVVSSTAVSLVGASFGDMMTLPTSKYTTAALSTTTASAGQLSGAQTVFMNNSGANPGTYTTRTGTQMVGDIPNAKVGSTYTVILSNGQATGTLTLAGGTDVTITGTATVAANVFRIFQVTIDTATTMTFQNIGSGVAP